MERLPNPSKGWGQCAYAPRDEVSSGAEVSKEREERTGQEIERVDDESAGACFVSGRSQARFSMRAVHDN